MAVKFSLFFAESRREGEEVIHLNWFGFWTYVGLFRSEGHNRYIQAVYKLVANIYRLARK